jgi:hypothetical protein
MCFRDLIQALNAEGITLTESQVRWALRTGKIDRPELDSSLRFVFRQDHVEQLRKLSHWRRTAPRQAA